MELISRFDLTRVCRNIQLICFDQFKVDVSALLNFCVKLSHYDGFEEVIVCVEEEEVGIVYENADHMSAMELKNDLVLSVVW